MKFRTEVKTSPNPLQLTIDTPVVLVGSCFANNIAARMRRCLWNARNPLGVLFNPLSIAAALDLLLFDSDGYSKFKDDSFDHDHLRHSWYFDSNVTDVPFHFSGRYASMRESLLTTLSEGRTLFVTFGTAFCYFLADRPDFVVGNCHKQPESMFVRRRISTDEICEAWKPLVAKLTEKFPALRIVLTVSPVRHLRDGLHENNLSKATLQLATDRLCSEFDCCSYFPAYEMVVDDLRDYRFYASDLAHPSEQAVEYIWTKFLDTYVCDETARHELKRGEAIVKRYNHRQVCRTELQEYRESLFNYETDMQFNSFVEDHPQSLYTPRTTAPLKTNFI